MAVSFGCKCEERAKPPAQRQWVVINRNCNYSAFNGYHRTYSQYSLVMCKRCGCLGRTNANFVASLPDGTLDDKLPQSAYNPGEDGAG